MSYMEFIYIDSDGAARQTGMRHAHETPRETLAYFRSLKRFDVDVNEADFLLDYHNKKGNLSDTIRVTREGFESITGTKAKSEAEYVALDHQFWDDARSKWLAVNEDKV